MTTGEAREKMVALIKELAAEGIEVYVSMDHIAVGSTSIDPLDLDWRPMTAEELKADRRKRRVAEDLANADPLDEIFDPAAARRRERGRSC